MDPLPFVLVYMARSVPRPNTSTRPPSHAIAAGVLMKTPPSDSQPPVSLP